MNADIRLQTGWVDHPKTLELARALGPGAPLLLLRLWLWAAEHRPSGELTGLAASDVERIAGWTGDAGRLFAALLRAPKGHEAGFLEQDQDGELVLHAWAEHQPWVTTAPARRAKARAAAAARWQAGQAEASDAPSSAGDVPGAVPYGNARSSPPSNARSIAPGNARSNAPSPSPIPDSSSPSLRSGDSSSPEVGAERAPAAPSSPPRRHPPDESPVVHAVEPSRKGAEPYRVTQAKLAAWRVAYPSIDVEGEVRKLIAWLAESPKRRPGSTTGVGQFFVRNLSRAQDRTTTTGREGYAPARRLEQVEPRMRAAGEVSGSPTRGKPGCPDCGGRGLVTRGTNGHAVEQFCECTGWRREAAPVKTAGATMPAKETPGVARRA